MRVNVLGPVQVDAGGRPIELGGARLRALIVRLALDAARPVTTEALVHALWGDELPGGHANALQSLVSRLRRALPPGILVSTPGGYRLDVRPDEVDAIRFEELAREGNRALAAADLTRAAQLLRRAESLWRAPVPPEAPAAAAARLAELRLAAIEDRVEAELRLGRSGPLVAELEELTAQHPMRERLAGLLLRALASTGRRAEALAAYERLRHRLSDELGVNPSPPLQAIHLALLRGEDLPGGAHAPSGTKPSAERTPKPKAGNLPAAYTSFVGRDEDLSRIAGLLAAERLVTLVGPGGAGKTRLAVAAGTRVGAATDGAWLAELAPVTEPEDVPAAVLRALDLRGSLPPEPAGLVNRHDLTSRLVSYLADSEVLLILDNCEHVLEVTARLTDTLLSRCPRLRVLATSREPLGLMGEVIHPVAPLRLPEPGASVAEALAYPVVQLLRDRGAAADPDFAVTEGNVAAVVEICRRLDGLPLAIELAAARLRTLSPRQVAERLDDRFRLLTGGSRTALPRHRTLRAVVAWSWDLLSEPERRLAEWLSVFHGGITAASAAGLASSAGLGGTTGLGGTAGGQDEAMADRLDALADKSLLQVDRAPGGPRYRMLDTIREFGLERLDAAGETHAARQAHGRFFRDLAERAEPMLRRAEQLTWIGVLTAERDNLLGALNYAHETGDADTAIRLGAALSVYWTMHGEEADAAEWLGRALRTPGPAPRDARAVCLALHAMYRVFGGDGDLDDALVAQLQALTRDVASNRTHPLITVIRPILAMFSGGPDSGLAAITAAGDHPDPWVRGMLLSARGHIKENDGDAEGTLADLQAAAQLFRHVGERWGLQNTLTALANAYTRQGDVPAAVAALEESIRLSQELNPDDPVYHQRIWLASMRAKAGDQHAHQQLHEFANLPSQPRMRWYGAFAGLALGDMARDAGDISEAEVVYRSARDRLGTAALASPQLYALIHTGLGYCQLARGDLADARTTIIEALGHATESRDMPVLAHVMVAYAHLHLAEDRLDAAAQLLGAAEQLRGGPDLSNRDAARIDAELRRRLPEATFAAAVGRGRALSRTEALALADPDPASVAKPALRTRQHYARRR